MQIGEQAAAKLLAGNDNILIFCHRKPDGDTVGSAFALLRALEILGKAARIECADPVPAGDYAKLFGPYTPKQFAPGFLVSVDVAGEDLLENVHMPYGGKIDLCIDHHKSNKLYAANTLLDAEAAACAEIVLRLVKALGVAGDKAIADAIYTGITTDTACFRHANATPYSLEAAAEMMRWGADSYAINKLIFSTKSRVRLAVETLLLESLEYALDGRYAQIYIPANVYKDYGVSEEELDGVSAIPRTIEGVLAGVTIRENQNGSYRVSMRTESPLDASKICHEFGGGGHKNAAGCTMTGSPAAIKQRLMDVISRELTDV